MLEYILFDLDGTLTDSSEGITKSVQYALEKMGIVEHDLEKLRPFIGPDLRESFMEYYKLNKEEAEQAVAYYRERFIPIGIYENKLYDNIKDILMYCKSKGILMGIASGKPEKYIGIILDHFGIREFFSTYVGSSLDGSFGEKSEVIQEALKRMGLIEKANYENTLMIGDRKFDIIGAKENKLFSVGVTYGFPSENELEEYGADKIIHTVSDLFFYIKERNDEFER
ncbi:MAG: HAD hydrolase-like protein [Lachnospiraceae bacterium]